MTVSRLGRLETYKTAFKAGRFDLMGFEPKQIEALTLLTSYDTSEDYFGGSAGGGKSWVGYSWQLFNCLCYPGVNYFLARHKKSQILESIVQTTLPKVHKRFGVDGSLFKINTQKGFIKFYNGSNIQFLELAYKPNEDPDYDRFGSTEFTGGWIEEMGGTAFKGFEVAKTRIGRHLNDKYNLKGKLFGTMNPSQGYVKRIVYLPWERGTLDPSMSFTPATVDDNTKIDKGYVESLDRLTGVEYLRKRKGEWHYNSKPNALIKGGLVDRSFNPDHEGDTDSGNAITMDVAGRGKDRLIIVAWNGRVAVDYRVIEKQIGEAVIMSHINLFMDRYDVTIDNVIFDADGIGGLLGGEGGGLQDAYEFINNSRPFFVKRDNIKSLKDWCGFSLGRNFHKYHFKSIIGTENEDDVRLELPLLEEKHYDDDTKPRQLVPKVDMKVALGKSPDWLDVILMREVRFGVKGTIQGGIVGKETIQNKHLDYDLGNEEASDQMWDSSTRGSGSPYIDPNEG